MSRTELSWDLMEVDPSDADLRPALTTAEPAPVASSQSTGDRLPAPPAPVSPQADWPDTPPTPKSPGAEPLLVWCDVCRN